VFTSMIPLTRMPNSQRGDVEGTGVCHGDGDRLGVMSLLILSWTLRLDEPYRCSVPDVAGISASFQSSSGQDSRAR